MGAGDLPTRKHVGGACESVSGCRYTFQSGTGVPVAFVAAAQKGRVYAMAAQTAPDADAATAAAMRRAVETFKCKDEFKPMY